METIVQFLARGDVFMAGGQRHIIKHVFCDGTKKEVLVVGQTAGDKRYFEATFTWGETVDTLDGVTL